MFSSDDDPEDNDQDLVEEEPHSLFDEHPREPLFEAYTGPNKNRKARADYFRLKGEIRRREEAGLTVHPASIKLLKEWKAIFEPEK